LPLDGRIAVEAAPERVLAHELIPQRRTHVEVGVEGIGKRAKLGAVVLLMIEVEQHEPRGRHRPRQPANMILQHIDRAIVVAERHEDARFFGDMRQLGHRQRIDRIARRKRPFDGAADGGRNRAAGHREAGGRVAQLRGRQRDRGGSPLLVLRGVAPPLPQQECRDQKRQADDGGDQRRVLLPPRRHRRRRLGFRWRSGRSGRISGRRARHSGARLRRFRSRRGHSVCRRFRCVSWRLRSFGGRFRGLRGLRLLCQFLRPQLLLHPLDHRGQLHDALAQHLRLGLDRIRAFLARSFAIRFRGERTRKGPGCPTRHGKPRRSRGSSRRRSRWLSRSHVPFGSWTFGSCSASRPVGLRR
jgi:hypothetical protein